MGEVIKFPPPKSRLLVEQRSLKINFRVRNYFKKKEIRGNYWRDIFVNAGAFIMEEAIKKEPEGSIFILLKRPDADGCNLSMDEFSYSKLTLSCMLVAYILKIENSLVFGSFSELILNAHCISLSPVINLNDWLSARTRGSRK